MSGIRQTELLVWLRLVRIYNKIQQRSTVHLKAYGLTPAQFDVLAQLHVAQGITQQELAQRLLVTKSNICGLLNRMSSSGLVIRRDDPKDRRSNRLYLTRAGMAKAAQVVPAHEAFIVELLAALNPNERRSLQLLLRCLDHSLGKA